MDVEQIQFESLSGRPQGSPGFLFRATIVRSWRKRERDNREGLLSALQFPDLENFEP
jgi:hypothetical protein